MATDANNNECDRQLRRFFAANCFINSVEMETHFQESEMGKGGEKSFIFNLL